MILQNGVLTFVSILRKSSELSFLYTYIHHIQLGIHIVFVFYFLNSNQSKSKEPAAESE